MIRLYRCTTILHFSIGSPHSKFIEYDIRFIFFVLIILFLDLINCHMFPSSSNKVNDNLCIFLQQIFCDI